MTRALFAIAALLFIGYVLNVLAGVLTAKFHAALWRLNDVGEFLVVLACMGFFVAALVTGERRQADADREGAANATKGGA